MLTLAMPQTEPEADRNSFAQVGREDRRGQARADAEFKDRATKPRRDLGADPGRPLSENLAPPDMPLGEIFRALLPFIGLQILAVALLIIFPGITWR